MIEIEFEFIVILNTFEFEWRYICNMICFNIYVCWWCRYIVLILSFLLLIKKKINLFFVIDKLDSQCLRKIRRKARAGTAGGGTIHTLWTLPHLPHWLPSPDHPLLLARDRVSHPRLVLLHPVECLLVIDVLLVLSSLRVSRFLLMGKPALSSLYNSNPHPNINNPHHHNNNNNPRPNNNKVLMMMLMRRWPFIRKMIMNAISLSPVATRKSLLYFCSICMLL